MLWGTFYDLFVITEPIHMKKKLTKWHGFLVIFSNPINIRRNYGKTALSNTHRLSLTALTVREWPRQEL